MYRIILLLALFLAQSQFAFAWWNEAWTFRKVITIDTTANGFELTEPTGEVTALVRLHTGNFGYFFDIRDGGADLRFMAADDLTPLKHHVEKLDPINEIALIWVKIPAVALASTEKIFMYYGNQAAITSSDVAGSFDEAETLVLHFDDATSAQDKTFSANHPVANTAEISKASLIGQGGLFDGQSSISFTNSPTLNLSSEIGWTFSSWIKPDAEAEDVVIFEYSDTATSLSLRQQGNVVIAQLKDANGETKSDPTLPLLIGDWQNISLVLQGQQMLLYLNGENPVATEIPILNLAGNLSLGAPLTAIATETATTSVDETTTDAVVDANTDESVANSGTSIAGFVGEMDEVRIANVARSAAWLMIAADNQGKNARLLSYGGDESQETEGSAEEGESGGYFGIIINNVFGNDHAIVEQIVIGFCGFMAIIAFIIMGYKAYTVFSAKGASKRFLKAYQALGADPDKFDGLFKAEKEFGDSPLFRVYKQGIIELRGRMSPSVGAEFAGLEQKSVNAIRSTLDATMVREGQGINSYIVLLTIAISGGPFIGLLGTVVGVMVTFAGIAAAGEVNINAIAPGMAAALLATVAGLGVAIPSLFGYNFLGSHIKELQADMHVFAEEFMGRLSESFGR